MTDATMASLRAVLCGLALGDAIGAPFEGRPHVERAEASAWVDADEPLRWTDDTHMALTLARTLCGGPLGGQRLGDAFAEAYAAEPWRGYGPGPPRVFSLVRSGMTYDAAAASLFGGTGSYGNGAAMRVAPVALAAGGDARHAAALAVRQARVTHTHPEAVDGAVFVATAICGLARRRAGDEVRSTLYDASRDLRDGALRREIVAVLDVDARGDDLLTHTRRRGTGVAARESVPASVAALLLGRDLPETLVTAVALGGDTDTVAAMAGAFAGARYGEEGLPARLLRRLEARDEIVRITTALLERPRSGDESV